MRARGYNFFVRLNRRRADLDLPQVDLPPAEPVFSPNPVAELVITNIGGKITLKLRVPSPPGQYTLVQGAKPVRSGVRCVQHFPYLGQGNRQSPNGVRGLRQAAEALRFERVSWVAEGLVWVGKV